MQEYPETNGYRRGYAACRAELGDRVVAWLEGQGIAFEAMLGACEAAALQGHHHGLCSSTHYHPRHPDESTSSGQRGCNCFVGLAKAALAKAKKGEA